MSRLKLPKKPPRHFVLRFWTTEGGPIRELTWHYWRKATCREVLGSDGVDYVDEWYTGGGRREGYLAGVSILRGPEVHFDYASAVKRRRAQLADEVVRACAQLERLKAEVESLR